MTRCLYCGEPDRGFIGEHMPSCPLVEIEKEPDAVKRTILRGELYRKREMTEDDIFKDIESRK